MRDNRKWREHPIHLVIKQAIIRSLKSNGGQKRGTGFKENQRGMLLFSLPISSTFNLKMPELTDVYLGISE